MKVIPIIISGALLVSTALTHAQNNPIAFSSDSRIKHVTYQDNNVIPIKAMALTTTEVLFNEQEQILDIEGGDTATWMVTFHPNLPNLFFVKPTLPNSDSNITVVTNRHHYYFHVVSQKKIVRAPEAQTYAVKVDYAEPARTVKAVNSRIATTASHPSQVATTPKQPPHPMNTAYRFSGSPQLVPLHVFDDGRFTYFELAANAPVPAIFAVEDKQGKENTVNIRRQGKYLVVQRTAPQFTLRSGAIVTSVFNINEISRIQQNRRPQ
jgi:type IV secretion system protein VirB9